MSNERDDQAVAVQDPPAPDLAETQQRDIPYQAVPVCVDGPVRTQAQPARMGPVQTYILESAEQQVLSNDLRRSRATLVTSATWNYLRKKGGTPAPWPANVPLILLHADEVWASGTTTLTVITEMYAD